MFVGEWMNGNKHGKGKLVMKNGRTIHGNWVDGILMNEGSMLEI